MVILVVIEGIKAHENKPAGQPYKSVQSKSSQGPQNIKFRLFRLEHRHPQPVNRISRKLLTGLEEYKPPPHQTGITHKFTTSQPYIPTVLDNWSTTTHTEFDHSLPYHYILQASASQFERESAFRVNHGDRSNDDPLPSVYVYNVGRTRCTQTHNCPNEAHDYLQSFINALKCVQAKGYTLQGAIYGASEASIFIDTDDEDWGGYVHIYDEEVLARASHGGVPSSD
ncbi:hypothetical protein BJ912DRAFT_922444 [Pholiota molesta]|nr:hypothetical protein BJ912DRAFT_922444 [Pholiota molesta]